MALPRVLFLCTANSCRSQMAEGFLRHLAGDRFEAASAGAQATRVNPDAVRVMKEVGIDISAHRSKDVSEFSGQPFTYVVRVCDKAKETCPIFPGAFRYFDWGLDDPAAAEGTEVERLAVFRRVRDEIEKRVRSFIAEVS
ncbi:MAG TPA: arsenate reductase ArsC [Terriglobia bacterium]|nr:arsenate reductase ArsC [Terriglobia bacterium]